MLPDAAEAFLRALGTQADCIVAIAEEPGIYPHWGGGPVVGVAKQATRGTV